jgi:uncharacterized protein YegL
MSMPEDPTGEYAATGHVLPAVICLDTSYSMAEHGKIDSLKRALTAFVKAVRGHTLAARSVVWEFVTFGGDVTMHLGVLAQASDMSEDPVAVVVPKLEPNDGTPLAEAVNLALDLLEAEVDDLKQMRRSYFRPWLVVMTDGQPTSELRDLEQAVDRVQAKLNDRRLVVIAVGIGPDADRDFLTSLSPQRAPDMIGDDDIERYFDHLSNELIEVSSGVPGKGDETVAPLTPPSHDG